MRFRKLRIAWSVGWGLAAALLVVLWVRSYASYEWIASGLNSKKDHNSISSHSGQLSFSHRADFGHTPIWLAVSTINDVVAERPKFEFRCYTKIPSERYSSSGIYLGVPHWFAVLFATALLAIPW